MKIKYFSIDPHNHIDEDLLKGAVHVETWQENYLKLLKPTICGIAFYSEKSAGDWVNPEQRWIPRYDTTANPSSPNFSEDIMGVHKQKCPDCRRLLIYDDEKIRQDYYEDGKPSGTTLVVTYKKCICKIYDPAVNDSIKDIQH